MGCCQGLGVLCDLLRFEHFAWVNYAVLAQVAAACAGDCTAELPPSDEPARFSRSAVHCVASVCCCLSDHSRNWQEMAREKMYNELNTLYHTEVSVMCAAGCNRTKATKQAHGKASVSAEDSRMVCGRVQSIRRFDICEIRSCRLKIWG